MPHVSRISILYHTGAGVLIITWYQLCSTPTTQKLDLGMVRVAPIALVALCHMSLLDKGFAISDDINLSNENKSKKLSRKRNLRISSNAGAESQKGRKVVAVDDNLDFSFDSEFGRMLENASHSMMSSSMPSRHLKIIAVPDEKDAESRSLDDSQILFDEEFGRLLENGSLSLSYMGSM